MLWITKAEGETQRQEFEKRGMQETCSNQRSMNIGIDDFERKLMKVKDYTDCNILDAHLGDSGDIYISGYGSSETSEFFILRSSEDFDMRWMRVDGNRKLYMSVDPNEQRVFIAEHSTSYIELEEIPAGTGATGSRYNVDNHQNDVHLCGMTFEPGTSSPLYIGSNSLTSSPDIWSKTPGSISSRIYNFGNNEKFGKMAYTSIGALLLHQQVNQDLYMSLLYLTPTTESRNLHYFVKYICPIGHSCSNDFEGSHVLVNPSNSSDGYALLEYSDDTDKITYFIFVRMDLSSRALIKEYAVANSTIQGFYSMRLYQDNMYFLVSVKTASGNIGNELLIFDTTSTSTPFNSLHQCWNSNDATTTCQSQYSTTATFIANQGLLTQMVINKGAFIFFGKYKGSCVRIKASDLVSLQNTQDWDNKASSTTYFTDVSSLTSFPFGCGNSSTAVKANNGYGWFTGASFVTVEQNQSSIIGQDQDFAVESSLSIDFNKGEEGIQNSSITCGQYDIFRFRYSITSVSDSEVYNLIKIDPYTGQISFTSTDYGTEDRHFTAIITISSPYFGDGIIITIPITVSEEHEFTKQLEEQQRVFRIALGISLAVGSISAFMPKSEFKVFGCLLISISFCCSLQCSTLLYILILGGLYILLVS
ncbi:unnamed protein product [Moneuplotes crassus]|uniref:Uncharacterized protein n=1 Tax=Euplotes crassus TaxID=5936 RepID=A0AAD1U219_EUPCR|nr:unnamed protein product [Moneuplotes crassus]